MSERDVEWMPIWYKKSVTTHSCRKLGIPHGRELLLCVAEDSGGSGHVHYLHPVDLSFVQ